ncbi:MAG: hypothetical protein ABIP51_03885 [Bacteroidia bacterium]
MNTLFRRNVFLASMSLFFVTNAFAQNDLVQQEENKRNISDGVNLEIIKNKNADDVEVEGVMIDKRVVKYYPSGELAHVPKEKAIKLNHIYLDSYDLVNTSTQNSDCELILKNEFDLGEYNYLRKENERVNVEINFKGCYFQLALYSWTEIDKVK